MMVEKFNVKEKFSLFQEHWSPKIVGQVNDTHIKLAKLKGEFIWHKHDEEDELFYVISGRVLLRFRDQDVILESGEGIVVPKGVEHQPIAEEEAHVLFVEPATTLNTGNIRNDRTKENLDTI